jgi:hypothetical protein
MTQLTIAQKYALSILLSQIEGEAATMRRALQEDANSYTQWIQNQAIADSYEALKNRLAKAGMTIEPYLQSIEPEIRR